MPKNDRWIERLKPLFLSYWLIPIIIGFWMLVIGSSYVTRSAMLDRVTMAMAQQRGETIFHLIQTTRFWNAEHGSVYVPVSATSPENPYLVTSEKNIETPSGLALTKINPAYMTRQISELLQEGDVQLRLTSDRVMNPNNRPDVWEERVLRRFIDQGLAYHLEVVGDRYRYMAPLLVEPGCLACHSGYEVGDVRGGLSISFPVEQMYALVKDLRQEKFWIHLVAFLLLSGIGVLSFFSIRKLLINLDDSSLLRQLNQQLADQSSAQNTLIQELNQLKQQAEGANQAKSAFLATMSHEIRTPMNGVLGLIEILAQDELSHRQKSLISTIRQSARNLLRLLDDILDVSKIEAGRLELEVQAVSLPLMLEHLKSTFTPICAQRRVQLHFHQDSELPDYIQADPTRLSQILYNLISNAVKFSGGPIEGDGQVSVTLKREANGRESLLILVKDNGIGMTSEQLEQVFEPFVQAESSTTRRFGGTGLGLSIVRRLVDQMQGEISADSIPRIGSLFRVRLPLIRATDEQIQALLQENPSAPTLCPEDLQKMRLLVAEDEPVNQRVIEHQLKRLGYHFDLVEDGAQALAALAQGNYDLLLTDLHMPVMDGYELVAKLRADEAAQAPGQPTQHLPIIALTANVLHTHEDAEKLEGFDGYLTKPVSLQSLNQALSAALSRNLASQGEGAHRLDPKADHPTQPE